MSKKYRTCICLERKLEILDYLLLNRNKEEFEDVFGTNAEGE
jgi:hypothetical protein